jgi:hypothetical protein
MNKLSKKYGSGKIGEKLGTDHFFVTVDSV